MGDLTKERLGQLARFVGLGLSLGDDGGVELDLQDARALILMASRCVSPETLELGKRYVSTIAGPMPGFVQARGDFVLAVARELFPDSEAVRLQEESARREGGGNG
jgi:hypothetical protein